MIDFTSRFKGPLRALTFSVSAWVLAMAATCAVADPVTLDLPPEATISASDSNPATSYTLFTGPWAADNQKQLTLEGTRVDTAWRLAANQQTSLQIFSPLRTQVEEAGYEILYSCATDACGGFDFRYGLGLLPEPGMHIDLGDFRYLAARKGPEYLALTVSRSSNSGFVHLTTLTRQATDTPQTDDPLAQDAPDVQPTGTALETEGSLVLEDLVFESGADRLKPGSYDSLQRLVDYLSQNPDTRVALVGHTDMQGTLDANIALSKRRAEAVMQRLIGDYGIDPARLTAQGAGWLAPRASNLTDEGRLRNRRVVVVLTQAGQ
ncbi:OmpA family protein [Rhodobacteraceae bacterium]|nr:OmpA family protein [Paracoccaceae bacterium]